MVAKMQSLLSQLSSERTHYRTKVVELQETIQRQEEKLQIYEKEIQSIGECLFSTNTEMSLTIEPL